MQMKRLQHVADTMCQVFCGWRLIESKPNLVNLGSGTLEINALTGQCLFQGKSIRQLRIAEEIRAWMQQDLATNNPNCAAHRRADSALERTRERDVLFGWKSSTHGENKSMYFGVLGPSYR